MQQFFLFNSEFFSHQISPSKVTMEKVDSRQTLCWIDTSMQNFTHVQCLQF